MSQSPPASQGAKVAFLFPGQGSQSVGMGRQLLEESPAARAVFEQVDAALGRPISVLMFEGPEEELQQTVNAQSAVMAVSLAVIKAMEERLGPGAMPAPAMMAGHSLGEYTALAAAGVLGLENTARLVDERSRLMQEACIQRPGTMAAILGLDEGVVQQVARETGTYVSNVNTGEQLVISGDVASVERAMALATSRGAKRVIPLRVGGAFHSALMEPARLGLEKAVSELSFRDPAVPIVANCTAQPLRTAQEVKAELVSQICSCVQWKRSVEYMLQGGVSRFIEVGPGKALAGMVKRIDKSATVMSIGDVDSILSLNKS